MKNSYEEALEGLETLKRENKNLQRELNVVSGELSTFHRKTQVTVSHLITQLCFGLVLFISHIYVSYHRGDL